jgi:hypothetical protein
MPLSEFRRKKCAEIVKNLLQHRIASIFADPVDPELDQCPDYFDVIERPMDLGTVLSKIERNRYETFRDFCADVDLVWQNATDYNGEESLIAMLAAQLSAWFHEMVENMSDSEPSDWFKRLMKLGASIRDAELPESVFPNVPETATASGGKRPRTKKAPMIYDFAIEPIRDEGGNVVAPPTSRPPVALPNRTVQPSSRPPVQPVSRAPVQPAPRPQPPPPPPVAPRPAQRVQPSAKAQPIPREDPVEEKGGRDRTRGRKMSDLETADLVEAVKSLDDEATIRKVIDIIRQYEMDLEVGEDAVLDFLDLAPTTRWTIRDFLDSLAD